MYNLILFSVLLLLAHFTPKFRAKFTETYSDYLWRFVYRLKEYLMPRQNQLNIAPLLVIVVIYLILQAAGTAN